MEARPQPKPCLASIPAGLLPLVLAGCYIYTEDGTHPARPAPAAPPGWSPDPAAPPTPAPHALPQDAGAARDSQATPTAPAGPACPQVAHPVDRWKELLIIDPTVVQDRRSRNENASAPWSFRRRLVDLTGDPETASDAARTWLESWRWLTSLPVTPGGPTGAARVAVAPRPSVDDVLLCPWLRRDPTNGCSVGCASCVARRLPLERAPFALLAIVNRADLAGGPACGDDGGELRFVYTAVDPSTGAPLPFTVIFEYGVSLPAEVDRRAWATHWRALGTVPQGEAYNQHLDALLAGVRGGLRLLRVHTNEVALGLRWEMRGFVPVTVDRGRAILEPAALASTPRQALDGSAQLASWLAQNPNAVLAGANRLPADFVAGAAEIPHAHFRWQAPGADPTLLAAFNRNTCNGCHGGRSLPGDLVFQHIAAGTGAPATSYGPAGMGPARVSRFLDDPSADDELDARARALQAAACSPCEPAGGYGR
jgi:hypothetical protein